MLCLPIGPHEVGGEGNQLPLGWQVDVVARGRLSAVHTKVAIDWTSPLRE